MSKAELFGESCKYFTWKATIYVITLEKQNKPLLYNIISITYKLKILL